jgi:hypothetical protein
MGEGGPQYTSFLVRCALRSRRSSAVRPIGTCEWQNLFELSLNVP